MIAPGIYLSIHKFVKTRLLGSCSARDTGVLHYFSTYKVYIEAVSREKRKPTPSGTESLLDLVYPELRSLARLWIAILRDYALLSLSQGILAYCISGQCMYECITRHLTLRFIIA